MDDDSDHGTGNDDERADGSSARRQTARAHNAGRCGSEPVPASERLRGNQGRLRDRRSGTGW
jgi:hypothetical protein